MKADGRNDISDKMLKDVKNVAYKQDDFGIDKYNTPLYSNMDYNWLKMIREELVDAEKYLQCEMERKQAVIFLLRQAVNTKDWAMVEMALTQLEKEGTGKQ